MEYKIGMSQVYVFVHNISLHELYIYRYVHIKHTKYPIRPCLSAYHPFSLMTLVAVQLYAHVKCVVY